MTNFPPVTNPSEVFLFWPFTRQIVAAWGEPNKAGILSTASCGAVPSQTNGGYLEKMWRL